MLEGGRAAEVEIMNIEDYQKKSARTLNRLSIQPTPQQIETLNYLLGLAGEFGEFQNAYLQTLLVDVTELGDVWWYLAAIHTVNDWPLHETVSSAGHLPTPSRPCHICIASLLERYKKHVYHGRVLDSDGFGMDLRHVVAHLLVFADGKALGNVLAMNHQKLLDRYPEKFTLGGGNRKAWKTPVLTELGSVRPDGVEFGEVKTDAR